MQPVPSATARELNLPSAHCSYSQAVEERHLQISATLAADLSSANSQSSNEDGDGAVSGSGSSSGGEMQTDIDRHVDAEAGGARMNAALTSMYGAALQPRTAAIAEVTPPATDAAPATEHPAEEAVAEAPPEAPPAFAPIHLVAAAAARALAAERGQQPRGKQQAAQHSRSTATGPAVTETAVGLQAMDLSPQAAGDATEPGPQTAAARQAGVTSTSGADARQEGTPAAGDRLLNNKKQRRRRSNESRCTQKNCHVLSCLL